MNLLKRIILGVGCAFFCCAVLAGFYSYRLSHHRWTVLEQSVRLEDGFSLSQPFTVELPTHYEVKIECRRTIPFETLNVALVRELGATCVISKNQVPIVHGDTSRATGSSSTTDFLSRSIGRFEAVPGQNYRLDLQITHSLPQLASTHPVAKISVEPRISGGAFVGSILTSYIAIGCTGLGILFAFPILLMMLPRHRADSPSTI